MKTLGHSQIGLTMNTCTHVLPDIERAAVDAAAETVFGWGGASRWLVGASWLHNWAAQEP